MSFSHAEENLDRISSSSLSSSHYVGFVEAYKLGKDDFKEYVERMEYFFMANKIIETQTKISLLMTFAGGEFQKKAASSIYPKRIKDITRYSILIRELTPHFVTTVNLRKERLRFMTRHFKYNEKLEDFIADIKQLSYSCDFGPFCDAMLQDKLISSVRNFKVQDYLVEQPTTKSFDELCKIAIEFIRLNPDTQPTERKRQHNQYESTREYSRSKYQRSDEIITMRCFYCGGPNHTETSCGIKKRDSQKHRQRFIRRSPST